MPPDIYPTALVLLAAGALQGFCGFGYSLLAMPLLLLMMPARTAVPALCVTGIALNGILLYRTRRSFDLKGLLPLALAGALFTPVGVWLIREIDPRTAKTVIGAGVALMAVGLLLNFRLGLKRNMVGMFTAGAASGLLNGFSTFSGPPVVLLLAAVGEERDKTRSCLAGYFLVLGVIGALSYTVMGILTTESLPGIGLLLPFTALGAILGTQLAVKTDSGRFRRLSLGIMAVLGAYSAIF